MRKLNEMFHVDEEGYLVKSSNGERVPEDEPVFILRGRDRLSTRTIAAYIHAMVEDGCDNERIEAVQDVLTRFLNFKRDAATRMKQPGCTQGR